MTFVFHTFSKIDDEHIYARVSHLLQEIVPQARVEAEIGLGTKVFIL